MATFRYPALARRMLPLTSKLMWMQWPRCWDVNPEMPRKTVDPTERVLAQVLRWPSRQAREWVVCFRETSESDPNIIAVIAVGSAVRPGVPSADVDLVAICRDPLLLKGARPFDVDLRAYPAADVMPGLRAGTTCSGRQSGLAEFYSSATVSGPSLSIGGVIGCRCLVPMLLEQELSRPTAALPTFSKSVTEMQCTSRRFAI